MKAKIKRHSHSALSVLLSLCMLVSCMTVGLIATDAAQVDSKPIAAEAEDESAGASVTQDEASQSEGAALDDNDSDDIGFDADNAVGAYSGDSVGAGDVVINGSAGGKTMYQKNGDYFYPTGQISSYSWKFRYNNKDYGSTSDNDSYRDIYSTGTANSKSVGVNRSSDFRWKGGSGKYTIWVNGDLSRTWVTAGTETIPTKNLTVSSVENAVVKVTQGNTTIAEGETKALNVGQSATLTVTPDTGWIPQKAVINGTEYALTKNGSNYEYSFTMPDAATTASATLVYVVTYSVTATVGEGGGGSVSVDKVSASPTETVTITATPKRGKAVSTFTVKDKNNNSVSVTPSGNTATFRMPSSDVKVEVTFTNATARTIQASAVSGGNGTLTVKITDSSGNVQESHTVDSSAGYETSAYEGEKIVLTASPSSGYQLDTLTADGDSTLSSGAEITVGNHNITDISATFKKNAAKNQYTAALGSGTGSTYNKVKATFFDYYTNGEFTDECWIGGIKHSERAIQTGYCAPYNQLNTALKAYASTNSLAYPLYFGNLYETSSATGDNTVNYNYNQYANNSNYLGGQNKAVPGLTGKTLSSNGLPNYFKSGATNDNGPEMKFFNRDWLSNASENGQGELASIIDSPFPMEAKEITTTGGKHIYYQFDSEKQNLWFEGLPTYSNSTVYFDDTNTQNSIWYAHFFNSTNTSNTRNIPMTNVEGHIWKADNPDTSVYDMVCFCKMSNSSAPYGSWGGNDSNVWNWTHDLTCPTGADNKLCFKTDGGYDGTNNKNMKGDWVAYKKVSPNPATPTVNYSTSASDAVYSPEYNNRGIYPFDHSHKGGQAWDLGFGVSMEIKFTLGPEGQTDDGADQKFEFTGDDDLWVFVDDHLVLDLGGAHKQTEGSINFHTLTVSAPATYSIGNGAVRNQKFGEWSSSTGSSVGAGEDYWFDTTKSAHTMKIFYLERGMYDSNLKFGFSMYPQPDEYDVEKIVDVDTNSLNPGLKGQFSDTFTFKNTSEDSKGGNSDYDVYKSSDDTKLTSESLKTNDQRDFSLEISDVGSGVPATVENKYAKFSKVFTVGKNLNTTEIISGRYQYDTSYKVLDLENNNSIVKAGDGTDTGPFKFRTTVAGADPDIDPTRFKTQFTNVLKTGSFIITKDILDFDDPDTEFPFKVTIKMPTAGNLAEYSFNTENLVYKSSSDGFTEPKSLGAGGIGVIHEYEYVRIDGIPLGAYVTVTEPYITDSKYTVNGVGKAKCYKMVTINNNQDVSGNQTILIPKPTDGTKFTEVTFNLKNFDIVTITNEPKTYRLDYKFPTRLYGDKIYKLTGYMTPDMVDKGYVYINGNVVGLTQMFASDNIPYESNFMKDIIWNSNPTDGTPSGHLDQTVSKPGVDDYNLFTAYSADKTLIVAIDTDGNGTYDKMIDELRCGEAILDGSSYVSGTKSGDTPSYWNIYKMDEITGAKGEFVAKCYSTDFNYVAYDNYFVDAVYGQGKNTEKYTALAEVTSVDLGITRNHWNDTVSGEPDSYGSYDLADTEYDRLYIDFALSYNINGLKINSNDTTGVSVGYKIVILNADDSVNKVVKTVSLNKTELDNKNRVHAYYGVKNTLANRGYTLGIIAYADHPGGHTESRPMKFELDTIGSKQASGFYDTGRPEE